MSDGFWLGVAQTAIGSTLGFVLGRADLLMGPENSRL